MSNIILRPQHRLTTEHLDLIILNTSILIVDYSQTGTAFANKIRHVR